MKGRRSTGIARVRRRMALLALSYAALLVATGCSLFPPEPHAFDELELYRSRDHAVSDTVDTVELEVRAFREGAPLALAVDVEVDSGELLAEGAEEGAGALHLETTEGIARFRYRCAPYVEEVVRVRVHTSLASFSREVTCAPPEAVDVVFEGCSEPLPADGASSCELTIRLRDPGTAARLSWRQLPLHVWVHGVRLDVAQPGVADPRVLVPEPGADPAAELEVMTDEAGSARVGVKSPRYGLVEVPLIMVAPVLGRPMFDPVGVEVSFEGEADVSLEVAATELFAGEHTEVEVAAFTILGAPAAGHPVTLDGPLALGPEGPLVDEITLGPEGRAQLYFVAPDVTEAGRVRAQAIYVDPLGPTSGRRAATAWVEVLPAADAGP